MNGTISVNGVLSIERGGTMRPQRCIRQDKYFCGDHCPQFGEPEEGRLEICQGRLLIFDKLTDLREGDVD